MEIEKEKTSNKNPFFWIDFLILVIKIFIGVLVTLFFASPIYILLHLFYLDKYGSFLMFTKIDFYIFLVSTIIFWLKIYLDNKSYKE